ncbi:hypothetical protein Ato02nite_005860 [Paractinoplanes toevensis]|uniref:Uncharacterized protein n=1 Tax=Paractinoplanes toevensis TaxID=571911 RepID=A0A919T3Z4_9ACTN|nr:hypothetical protein Ato02nite_005860 [Actinoplanes toevensis]
MTRSWRMFAGRGSVPERPFHRFGDERTVRFCGLDPVPVELVEDPDGPYWGFIVTRPRVPGAPVTGVPAMVQGHEGMFRMQSPDGFKSDVESGRGEVVRMSCRELDSPTP